MYSGSYGSFSSYERQNHPGFRTLICQLRPEELVGSGALVNVLARQTQQAADASNGGLELIDGDVSERGYQPLLGKADGSSWQPSTGPASSRASRVA